MNVADRVREIVERALEGGDVEFVDVTVSGQGSVKIVTVTVDKPGGVTVDDCAAASNVVGAALEDEDPIRGRYRLDVQSPGLERPLRTEAEFGRALGTKVSVKRHGHAPLVGTLASADGRGIEVATGDGAVAVGYDEVVRARTVLDWGGNARGKKRGKTR
ncbi:MAG: ribosome maturation factor RimP [Acidimicrobiia bacterium]|nr:ribosome maturation factor RimP [Acidimicrobiia bacterium]